MCTYLAHSNAYHDKCILFTMHASAVSGSLRCVGIRFTRTSESVISPHKPLYMYSYFMCHSSMQSEPIDRFWFDAACVSSCRKAYTVDNTNNKNIEYIAYNFIIYMRRSKQRAHCLRAVVVFFSSSFFSLIFFRVFFCSCWHALSCYETHAVLNTLCSHHQNTCALTPYNV